MSSYSSIPETYEDLFHEVFDHSSQGFQVIDTDWRYLYVNAEVARQGRSQPKDLIGHTMMELYPGIEKTKLFTSMKRVMDEKVAISMENEFMFPDSSRGWFQLFIHPYAGGIYIFSVEISDRKALALTVKNMVKQLFDEYSSFIQDRKLLDDLKSATEKLYNPEPVERTQ